MANNVTAVELSKDGIRVATGYYYQERLHVISAVKGNPLPVNENGEILSDDAVKSLSSLLAQNRDISGEDEGPYIVSLPPDGVSFSTGRSQSGTLSSTISSIDCQNCLTIFTKQNGTPDSSILCAIPVSFKDSNNFTYTEFPLGTPSSLLYLEADAVNIPETTFDHYKKILAKCNVFPYLYYISPIPSIHLIGKQAKEFNIYLALNIENRYSYLSLVEGGRLKSVKVFNYGMDNITSYAGRKLSLDHSRALELRKLFGFVCEENISHPCADVKNVRSVNKAFEEGLSLLSEDLNKYIDTLSLGDVPVILYGPSTDENGLSTVLGNQIGLQTFDFSQVIYGAFDQSYVGCLGMIYMSSLPYQMSIKDARKIQRNEEMKSVSIGRK